MTDSGVFWLSYMSMYGAWYTLWEPTEHPLSSFSLGITGANLLKEPHPTLYSLSLQEYPTFLSGNDVGLETVCRMENAIALVL